MRAKIKLVALVMLVMGACAIIIEKDVSDDQLIVVAPSDSVLIDDGNVTFRWELLNGATNYELFVVSPKFGKIQNVALDTIFGEVNGYDAVLEPGEYEWSIRALNSAYSTMPVIRSFSVLDSAKILDISKETLVLFSPEDQEVWDSNSVIFTWQQIEKATEYHLTIASPSLEQPKEILFDDAVDNNRIELNLENGKYEWEVKGVNKYSETSETSWAFEVLGSE